MGGGPESLGVCPALPLAAPQVNLLVPVAYLVFWAFLLVFSFISEPMVCGVGVIIILTGVPVFFLGVFWRSKPKCVHRLTGELGSSPGPADRTLFGVCPRAGISRQPRWPHGAQPPPEVCPWSGSSVWVPRAESCSLRTPVPRGQTPVSMCWSVCLSSESVTRWGQELCFVVYPQGSPEEEENGPCQPSPLPATDKPLKTQ